MIQQANIHTHVRNEVTLVWGLLRLTQIITRPVADNTMYTPVVVFHLSITSLPPKVWARHLLGHTLLSPPTNYNHAKLSTEIQSTD